MNATIDFAGIRSTVNLHDLVESDLGPAMRGGRWVCPFHSDASNANFGVKGSTWHCFSCGAKGDALDYLVRRDGITLVEAASKLGGTACDARVKAARPKPKPAESRVETDRPVWEAPDWQEAVESIVTEAESILWSDSGREAMAHLLSRGLDGSTIRRFRLGFIPRDAVKGPLDALRGDRSRPPTIHTSRGITIPWGHPGASYGGDESGPRWVGLQVRRFNDDFSNPTPKYRAIRGSERGHAYPFAHAVPGLPALVCEGELDALLAWQEIGASVNVLTVGGVSQTPRSDAMKVLHDSPAWLLAFDHDENHAGDNGARKFSGLAPHKCRRALFPNGANDLTDFHQRGGNLRDWLASEFGRFGWHWPSVPIATDPLAWRMEAARMPHDEWLAWRHRAAEILATYRGPITEADVRLADRTALTN